MNREYAEKVEVLLRLLPIVMTEKGYIARREKDGEWDVFIIPSA